MVAQSSGSFWRATGTRLELCRHRNIFGNCKQRIFLVENYLPHEIHNRIITPG